MLCIAFITISEKRTFAHNIIGKTANRKYQTSLEFKDQVVNRGYNPYTPCSIDFSVVKHSYYSQSQRINNSTLNHIEHVCTTIITWGTLIQLPKTINL
ncbi:hypothetical protein CISIN_1g040268mg [Citrus sinensis]|uniref:Uncharacterized protein n=1 Tax=Citrus sinensis TaxID=2711 RepID=A0A067DJ66_CITSI|nr:hypothetical protein CISIN_1g040268mg [Citrus sinensis]